MPYFDTSLTTANTVNQGVLGIPTDSVAATPFVALPSVQVSQSVAAAVTPTTPTDPLTAVLASTDNYLSTALRSATATFDTAAKSLATGISPSLASIFTNTNNPQSSTTSTLISDPITTNLINKKNPGSGTFLVGPLQSGSSLATSQGATSIFGTGASSMQGVSLTTLLNRVNLDIKSVANLPNALVTDSSASKLSGLFANLSVGAGSLTGGLVASATGDTSLAGLAAGITTGVTSSALGVSSSPIVARALTNDLSLFLGNAAPINRALGYKDSSTQLSSYFVTNPSYSLINSTTNAPVTTNNSGVDATTANGLLQLIGKTGCATNVSNYSSAHVQASSFNLALELAAVNGISDLVSSLLGCSHASSAIGQRSLQNAFSAAAPSQIGIASQILSSIQSPSTLNNSTIASSILTNPNLTPNDVGTVDSIFTTLGTTTTNSFLDPISSSPRYPVYDVSLLANSPPAFVDTTFNSSDFTDYFNGSAMAITDDGTLDLFH